ncbi:MAG: hypothetical protein JW801_04375 [Bacteroidales bacterium]|nr:hypothetical protein [Bacteroidales bacterium]
MAYILVIGEFFHNIFQFFFLVGYIILFIVSIIILRPFRVHKRRRVSTMSIKLSYLIFLALFLSFTYMLLFGPKSTENTDTTNEPEFFNVYFLIFLSSTIIPNIGIMIRRRIKKKRVEYNFSLTVINLMYAAYLLFLILTERWALM